MIKLLPYAIVWGILAVVVIALAVMRKIIASREIDTLHVSDASVASLNEQATLSHKLDSIDKWGKLLTIVAFVTGLILGSVWIYVIWQESAGYVVR